MKQSVSSLTFRLKEKILEYRARIRFRINDALGYHIVYAYDCQNIEIENVRITEPSTWTVKSERRPDTTSQTSASKIVTSLPQI